MGGNRVRNNDVSGGGGGYSCGGGGSGYGDGRRDGGYNKPPPEPPVQDPYMVAGSMDVDLLINMVSEARRSVNGNESKGE